MTHKKLYRMDTQGLVDLENHDACIGQVYQAPNQCDVCKQCGINVFEISYMSEDVCFCGDCLRVLADLVESFRELE